MDINQDLKKKTIIVNLDKGACIFVNFVWIFTPTHKNHNLPYKLDFYLEFKTSVHVREWD